MPNLTTRARALHAWDARIQLLEEADRLRVELEEAKREIRILTETDDARLSVAEQQRDDARAELEQAQKLARGACEDVERLLAEREELRAKLADPVISAVLALLADRDRQYRRAEAAHDAKDEANRRWLEATTKPDVSRHARPIDIPPCDHSPDECPPIEETAMTETTPHDDWFDLCAAAELAVPHEPHPYSTPEPSGCPGYAAPASADVPIGPKPRPDCNCFMRGGKHSFKCDLARNGRPGLTTA